MKSTGVFALIITLLWPSFAGAYLEGLDLRTELQYRTLDLKSRDIGLQTSGGLSTNYSLALRQPLTPWAKLLTNLTVNSLASNDQFGKQQSSNMIFNLSSAESTYSFTMGYVQNGYRSLRSLANGPSAVSLGRDRSFDLNFFMDEPSYPTLNLQFRRHSSALGSGPASINSNSTSWLAGALYEFAPLRFSIDQSRQSLRSSAGQPTSTLDHRRMAVNFDQKLLSGLNVTGEFSKDWSGISGVSRTPNTFSGGVKSVRITATPTPAVVITADNYIRDSKQKFAGFTTTGSNKGTNISMRSEILPGLALNLLKAHTLQTDLGRRATSDNMTMSVNAVLAPDVLLNVSHGRIKQSVFPQASLSTAISTLATLLMPAGQGLDVTLDLGTTKSSSSFGTPFNSKYIGATIRGPLSADATAGLSYRKNNYTSSGLSVINQSTDTVDLDLSWMLSSNFSLDARLNYYLNQGSNISEYISPYIDARWSPNNQSSLIMHYNFSMSRQWDWIKRKFTDRGDKGLSVAFRQQLSSDSSLDLIYDFQGTDIGDLAWQRSMQVLFTHRL